MISPSIKRNTLMGELLKEKRGAFSLPKIGDIVEGQIIAKSANTVFIDLGNFGIGIIFGREFYDALDGLKRTKLGDKITAKVVDFENEDGYIELSLKEAGEEISWENLKQIKEKGEVLKVRVKNANKGGLIAEAQGQLAFLPVSQLSPMHYPRVGGGDAAKIVQELRKLVGQMIEVKIIDIDPQEGKLILSEKSAQDKEISEILKNYKAGQTVAGEITGIVNFGIFVKFGKEKLEGLVHISELDWQLVKDPRDIVEVGQKVKAKIIDIENGRVSLSLKALKKDPWEKVKEKHKKGDIIKGIVTKFNPFGAFVEVEKNITGLVHISEFGSEKRMRETLELGKKYEFKILNLVPDEHKMALILA